MVFWRLVYIVAFAVPLAAGGMGCAHRQEAGNEPLNQWLVKRAEELPPADYRVACPDVLLIVAPRIKELDQTLHKIRPDGCISLPSIGDVSVDGLSTEEVAKRLRELALAYYDKSLVDIRVQVAQFNSKFIYVFGQVRKPGPKPYTGRDTVLGVLADARLTDLAWPQKVVVVRKGPDVAVREKVTVDLKRMYERGEVEQNYLLEEGDVVYILTSPLAQFGLITAQMLGAFTAPPGLVLLAATAY